MYTLQFITHYTSKYSYIDAACMALLGGCKWIQLRMKNAHENQVKETALHLQTLCKKYHATFIIDDHVQLVKEIGADGVHLGQHDMPIAQARKLLGDNYIIGATANTYEQVAEQYRNSANYIGCGPFQFTTTKDNLSPTLGKEGYQHIVKRMHQNEIKIPVVAIGGITYNDIPPLLTTGIDGVALSSTILNAENPIVETKRILQLLANIN